MTFHVGQKVVCIDADFGLVEGEVYTVKSNRSSEDLLGRYKGELYNGPILRLMEIENFFSIDGHYSSLRFRPVRTTDISIFKAMLVSPPKQRVTA